MNAVYSSAFLPQSLFDSADAQYASVKDKLVSVDWSRLDHGELERRLAPEAFELMRRLLQSHLTLRGQAKPTLAEIKAAVLDIFYARARDAAALGLPPRTWPTVLTPYPHWGVSFARAAESVGLDVGLEDAVEQVNTWIKLVDGA